MVGGKPWTYSKTICEIVCGGLEIYGLQMGFGFEMCKISTFGPKVARKAGGVLV